MKSNITIIKREYNEQRIKENLKKRVEFFKKNKEHLKEVKIKKNKGYMIHIEDLIWKIIITWINVY